MTPETDPLAELVAAFRADDADALVRTLERHHELKSRLDDPAPGVPFGGTALLEAARRRNRDMIEALLRAGANINAKSHWWAGGFGVLDQDHDSDFVSFLIERGAVVDIHAAARLGRLDRLEELVTANPELVHARGGDGQTPLHVARTAEVARYLLDHGADIDARDVDHESTPAQYMARDRQDVARYLVSRGCQTDILMAAALGDLALVKKYLETDPASVRVTVSERDFPMRDPRAGGTIYIWTLGAHKTPHMVAREFGHEEVFRLLIDHSPPELRLSVACVVGDDALVKNVLATHSNVVESLTEDDKRRLPHAAQDNDTAAVRRMLAIGWPVDARGQHRATALHWAAFHGNAEMAREILKYGPPLEIRDDDYKGTPLNWSIYGSVHGWHRQTGDFAGAVEALLAAGVAPPPMSEIGEASEAVLAVLRRR